MAVRTAFAGTTSPGDVLTSAQITRLPGGWIGYAEVTANQTGISSITDLTSLTVTVTAGTSRRLLITGRGRVTQASSAASSVMSIRNGAGTILQESAQTLEVGYTAVPLPMSVQTPSSGSNTYKLSLSTPAGTIDLNAAATYPAFILVTDVGPSA
jgi:hypothetical protein